MFDPNNPLKGITPSLPEADPANNSAVKSMNEGQSYGSMLTQQASTPFGQSVDTTKQPIGGYVNQTGKGGGGLYNYDAKPAGSMQNDQSLTNSYLSALNTYGDMRKLQGEMDGIQQPQPQPSALPNFNADQAKAFFSALGRMFGGAGQQPGQTGQTGLNQLFGGMSQQPQAPQMVAGDNSRFANDPFKVNANALR